MAITLKINKLISVLLLIVFISMSFFNVVPSTAWAATGATGESESEALSKIHIVPANGDTLNCVKLDGRPQLCRFAYYVGRDESGAEKNYPTYCVEPNLEGVNTLGEYEAILTETVKHPRVYGAVLNGYPYKTLGELGVNTNLEGYYATRNVVWSLVKGWNISQWTSDGSAEGNRVLSAMQQIYATAKDYTELPVELMVKVTKNSEKATVDTKDSQYVSTTYTITANKELIENISVELEPNGAAPSAKIVDMNNNPKTSFALNDDFKVIVAKTEADAAKDLKLDLHIQVKGKDNAIFYAKSQNPHGQDYYAARDPIAVKNVATTFLYGAATEPDIPKPDEPITPPAPNVNGKLNIVKQDSANNSGLAGAQFEVLKNGSHIGFYATNSQGKIEIPINTDTRIGYVDTHDGQVHYRNMEKNKVYDTYTITEIDPPFGYLLDDNPVQTVTTIADGLGGVIDDTLVVTFRNARYGGLTIQKTDADTNAPLKNATFRVTYLPGADDSHHFTTDITTSGTGMASLSNLKPGSYSIQEITPPAGYILNDKLETITITEGQTTTFSAVNSHKPGLEITKLDANELTPIAGVTFNIKGIDSSFDQDFTTDAAGKIVLEDVEAGSYQITETAVPPDYKLDSSNTRSIELSPGQSIQLTFYNEKLPFLEINKVDKQSKKPLVGVTFTIEQKGGTSLGDYTTDAAGKIRLDNLPEGWYTITEKAVPEGVILDKTPHDIFVEARQSVSITLENSIKPKFVIQKNDSVTHSPLANAKFQVWHAVNGSLSGELQSIGIFTTDNNGQIDLGQVEPGWYRIKETEPPQGYTSTNLPSRDVFMAADEDQTLTFENTPKSALVVKKVDADSGEPLTGAKFNVRYLSGTSGTGGTVIGEYTTGVNGTFIVTGLEAGTYVVEETQAPENYIMTSDVAKTVYISGQEQDVVTIEFTNKRISGLLVRKLDSVTKQPLAGAEFKITDSSGAVVGSSNGLYTTDADGYIHLPDIEPGTYIVVEQKSPAGYLLDQTPQTIKIESNTTHDLTFYNQPIGGLLIKKMDAETKEPLADAIFKVTTGDGTVVGTNENGEYRTDEKGYISIEGLKPDTYIITEVQAKSGYILDDTPKTVVIKDHKTYTIEFFNHRQSSLIIQKIDAESKLPLVGAVFQIEKQNGERVSIGSNGGSGEYVTDENGLITLKELPPDWYIIKEIKAPNGYEIDTTSKTVEVKKDTPTTVTFTNKPQAALQIQKIDDVSGEGLAGAKFKITKQNGELVGEYETDKSGLINLPHTPSGWYVVTETKAPTGYILDEIPQTIEVKTGVPTKATFTNKRIAGLQIKKVVAQTGEPLSGVKFDIEKMNGERMGTYTTDKNGLIYVSLEPGYYVVRETFAPKGYKMDSAPHHVEIKANEPTILEIANQQVSGMRIHKVDADTGEGIYGVRFLLKDDKNNLIGEYSTDDDGYIDLEKELPDGKYKLEEIEAADGYIKDTKVKTITVRNGYTEEIIWKNKAIKGQIQLIKKSADYNELKGLPAGSPLSGAVFEITNPKNNRVLDKIVTDSRGIAASKPLPLGRYLVKEIQAPDGYGLNPNMYELELKIEGDIVRFEILDQSVQMGVSIKKEGNKEVIAGSQMYYNLSQISNLSNTTLSNFYLHDAIPTDAVTLEKVITGTYNQRLHYNIFYKTNFHDYRTLGSNLLTSNNYEFATTNQALGLMAGEYVTDIRFDFGNVQPGFLEKEQPIFVVTVKPNLPGEYRIVNKADVGGRYNNEWQTAKDSWVTIVYGKAKPQKLPQTGY